MTLLQTARGTFDVIMDGPLDGPVVILLHGFPELNISWRHQIPALAAAGYGAGWETYLDPFLTAHLAGHEASDWMEIWQERHAAYGAALRERGWLVE